MRKLWSKELVLRKVQSQQTYGEQTFVRNCKQVCNYTLVGI